MEFLFRKYIHRKDEYNIKQSNITLFFILFIYVFAFFLGPLSTSLILGVFLWAITLFNKRLYKASVFVVRTNLFYCIFRYWIFVVLLGLLYNIIYLTFDFSFISIYIIQLFHYVAAIPVLGYLYLKKYDSQQIERQFINIFIAQTFIQLIVASNPTWRTFMFNFNHFDPSTVVGMGDNFRGSALAAATTYHLSLAYGICFIVYIKQYITKDVSIKSIVIGLLIFAGIFCAGRSGFVGCIIGLGGFIIMPNKFLSKKKLLIILKFSLYAIILSIITLIVLAQVLPKFYEMLNQYILPYAFEFIYNQQSSGNIESASTNRLIEMWNEDFNYIEFFLGSGHFSNPDGSYYMHVDPGILRHLLYFGIVGYVFIIYYQYTVIPFCRMGNENRFFCALIFIFILIMDFKGLTAGGNKFMIFIPLLLSFTYLYLPKVKDEKDFIYHGISSQ